MTLCTITKATLSDSTAPISKGRHGTLMIEPQKGLFVFVSLAKEGLIIQRGEELTLIPLDNLLVAALPPNHS